MYFLPSCTDQYTKLCQVFSLSASVFYTDKRNIVFIAKEPHIIICLVIWFSPWRGIYTHTNRSGLYNSPLLCNDRSQGRWTVSSLSSLTTAGSRVEKGAPRFKTIPRLYHRTNSEHRFPYTRDTHTHKRRQTYYIFPLIHFTVLFKLYQTNPYVMKYINIHNIFIHINNS